jgi:hypothetical protein
MEKRLVFRRQRFDLSERAHLKRPAIEKGRRV